MNRLFHRAVLGAFLWLVACALPPQPPSYTPFNDPTNTHHPERMSPIDILHYKIEVTADERLKKVGGQVTVTFAPVVEELNVIELDAADMVITRVEAADGRDLSYRMAPHKLIIHLDPPIRKRAEVKHVVVIHYEGSPTRGMYFVQPDSSYPDKPVQIWTQGEPEDNHHWLPCYDFPNDRATHDLIVTVRKPYEVVSNGELAAVTDAQAGWRTFHWKMEFPLPSYLIAMVAGEFDRSGRSYQDHRGEIPLTYVSPRGRYAPGLVQSAFGGTPEMMKFFSEKIGTRYPFKKYDQVVVEDFIFGAMENATVTTFGAAMLTDRAESTLPLHWSESVVAHELAHHWFGDLLTCRSWAHLWLNEGFAVYFEKLYLEARHGVDEFRNSMRGAQESVLGEDAGRYRRPVVCEVYTDPIDLFDAHTYSKGACVLHMLRHELGDEQFWKAIQLYAARHFNQVVGTDDLRKAAEEASGVNLERFFRQWCTLAGHPELEVSTQWDEQTKMLSVSVAQAQKIDERTPLFRFLVDIEVVTAKEKKTYTVRIEEQKEKIQLPLDSRPLMVVFDKGGWVLKKIRFKKSIDELIYQLKNDDDVNGRVFAVNELGEAGNKEEALAALKEAMLHDSFHAVRRAAAGALGKSKLNFALWALKEGLRDPHEGVRQSVVDGMGNFSDPEVEKILVDVIKNDKALPVRRVSARSLGKHLKLATEGQDREGAVNVMTGLLKEYTTVEALRTGVIEGISEIPDAARVVPLLEEHSRYGQPLRVRQAAIAGLGRFEKSEAAANALAALLPENNFRILTAAIRALGDVRHESSRPALEKISQHAFDGRLRQAARQSIQKIRETKPR